MQLHALHPLLLLFVVLVNPACSDENTTPTGPAKIEAIDTSSGAPQTGARGEYIPSTGTQPNSNNAEPASELSLSLRPFKARYVPGDVLRVELLANIGDGNYQTVPTAQFTVVPDGSATLEAPNSITLTQPGTVTVRGCNEKERCAERTINVSSALDVMISSPQRAAALDGSENGSTIMVRGRVLNADWPAIISLNGGQETTVTADNDGQFEIPFEASFGYNPVRISFKDSSTVVPASKSFHVLWAPEYRPANEQSIVVDNALTAHLYQKALDTGVPFSGDIDSPSADALDMAQMVELLAKYLDVSGLLSAQTRLNLERASFEATGLRVTSADVQLQLTDNGIDLSLMPAQLTLTTDGQYTVDNSNSLSLSGTIDAAVSAFSEIKVTLGDGLDLAISPPQISIDPDVVFNFDDMDVRTVLETFREPITSVAQSLGNELTRDLVETDLPQLLKEAFDALIIQLQGIPILIDPMLPGLSSTQLTMGFEPKTLEHHGRDKASLSLQANIAYTAGPATNTTMNGIPINPHPAPTAPVLAAISVDVDLELFNTLCFAVWKTGLLNGQPDISELLPFFDGVVRIESPLPPVIVVREDLVPQRLEFQLSELLVTLTREGFDGPDTYAFSSRVSLSPQANAGFIELIIGDDEMIAVELLDSQSGDPLAPELFQTLAEAIWPQLKETIEASLRYGIEPVQLNQEVLSHFTQGIAGIEFGPDLGSRFTIAPGWVSFEGNLKMTARFAAE